MIYCGSQLRSASYLLSGVRRTSGNCVSFFPSASVGSGCTSFTVMYPSIHGCMVQKYSYCPDFVNVCDQVLPGLIVPLSNKPDGCPMLFCISPSLPPAFPLVTVCPSVSWLIHMRV